MTEEEVARFSLVLREAERVRAMIAEDTAAAGQEGGGGGGIPVAAEPAEEWTPIVALIAA